jgi:hypothetical protein
MQTRAESLIEAAVNIAIGYVIAIASQIVIFPACGVEASLRQNLAIGAGFTAVSLVRQYVIRRWFNRRMFCRRCKNG